MRLRVPWRRRRDSAAAPDRPAVRQPPAAAWPTLPTLRTVLPAHVDTVVSPGRFRAGLATTWRQPPALGRLQHLVHPDAPAGRVAGLPVPVEAYDGPPLTFARPSAAEEPQPVAWPTVPRPQPGRAARMPPPETARAPVPALRTHPEPTAPAVQRAPGQPQPLQPAGVTPLPQPDDRLPPSMPTLAEQPDHGPQVTGLAPGAPVTDPVAVDLPRPDTEARQPWPDPVVRPDLPTAAHPVESANDEPATVPDQRDGARDTRVRPESASVEPAPSAEHTEPRHPDRPAARPEAAIAHLVEAPPVLARDLVGRRPLPRWLPTPSGPLPAPVPVAMGAAAMPMPAVHDAGPTATGPTAAVPWHRASSPDPDRTTARPFAPEQSVAPPAHAVPADAAHTEASGLPDWWPADGALSAALGGDRLPAPGPLDETSDAPPQPGPLAPGLANEPAGPTRTHQTESAPDRTMAPPVPRLPGALRQVRRPGAGTAPDLPGARRVPWPVPAGPDPAGVRPAPVPDGAAAPALSPRPGARPGAAVHRVRRPVPELLRSEPSLRPAPSPDPLPPLDLPLPADAAEATDDGWGDPQPRPEPAPSPTPQRPATAPPTAEDVAAQVRHALLVDRERAGSLADLW